MTIQFSRLRAVLVACVLAIAALYPAVILAQSEPAQSSQAPTADSAAWAILADRAEGIIESGDSSEEALTRLREELVVFRQQFLEAQDANASRIATLGNQIAALGPEPAEGDPAEPEEIAARRSELEAQMARLQAPGLRAEEAYNRANGLVAEIDITLRERQASALRKQGPSPLNPALWPEAWSVFTKSLLDLKDEIVVSTSTGEQREQLKQHLPQILFYLVIAAALVLRGRVWMEQLTLAIYSGRRFQGTGVAAFLASLFQVIVPVLGMIALRQAFLASGLLGLRGQILAEALPAVGVILFSGLWLGGRLFPRSENEPTPLALRHEQRIEGRWYLSLLGLLLSLLLLVGRLAEFDSYSDGVTAVLLFPLIVATGLIVARVGMLISAAVVYTHDDSDPAPADRGYLQRAFGLVGKLTILSGIAGPVLAAAGYLNAGVALIFPTVLTLALLGTLALLNILVRDIYALLRGRSPEDAAEALTPILVSFVLVLLSLPLFALIWGARVTDLWEVWTRFQEGFAVGETRISPSDFLTFVIVFAIGYIVTRLLQSTLKVNILPKTRMDTGGRNAITAGVGYIGIFAASIAAITTAGIDLSSLAIVAGALSVGIGFGLQNIVSNFVSGIILLIERPISEGDWIEVGGQMGYVRDISVRSTRIETFDRTDVIVPNADFVSGTVTNWTRGNLVGRCLVPVGVAYGSDTRQVEQILLEIAKDHPMVVLNPPPAVLLLGFGADSLNFEIRAILRDVNFVMSVASDMNHEIVRRFAAAGIEIPFAQRDLWLRNPEVLAPRGAGPANGEPAAPARAPAAPVRDNDGDGGQGAIPDGMEGR
ncbi:DUF3772 domain-containing protein [Profundibacterium mesophilum]|uniref:Potassium efflux system KEFA n=1 Tax=Profundibacterium mesophilum KAUST100406-0324 TaxID=1037889 RepID=A0A921NXJ7_9RHOB|nr:DUF3772 domain-containing protein [Profundibacterium mesophilum]KAF0677538.1 Potassium efflux system KEFA [Profundibacterium mesophilum KAUST100406-0324]